MAWENYPDDLTLSRIPSDKCDRTSYNQSVTINRKIPQSSLPLRASASPREKNIYTTNFSIYTYISVAIFNQYRQEFLYLQQLQKPPNKRSSKFEKSLRVFLQCSRVPSLLDFKLNLYVQIIHLLIYEDFQRMVWG
ncbi:hypothetical protein BV372_13880 [Nostoc sp. T09]|nr:hypothetical protein BV372_13880 [Nostoc sp. T09]